MLKVLCIAHNATLDTSRSRYYSLRNRRDVLPTLLIPNKWEEFGRKIPVQASSGELDIRIKPIKFGRMGPAMWYLHYYPSLESIIRDIAPDVIHLWEEPWSMVAVQAARLCQKSFKDVALVLETEQNVLRRLPPPFEWMRRYTLSQTDLILGRQQEAISVCRSCGYKGEAAEVGYCVDTNLFSPKPSLNASKPGANAALTLGYAGRLIKEKGLSVVLQALSRCGSNTEFRVLGEGPEREALEREAEALGIDHRVKFIPKGPAHEVARFMNSIDVFVLMSQTTRTWKEQFGRVIIEAQACGTPVIGSDSGAIPDVIGEGGWIVAESDATKLGKLVDHLARNDQEVKMIGQRALKNAICRYSPEKVAGDLATAFAQASSARKLRRERRAPVRR